MRRIEIIRHFYRIIFWVDLFLMLTYVSTFRFMVYICYSYYFFPSSFSSRGKAIAIIEICRYGVIRVISAKDTILFET